MRTILCIAGGVLGLLASTAGAGAGGPAGLAKTVPAGTVGTIVQKVHSVYEARQTLYGLGYYDVRVERASVPYSFIACKRGARYHIHVNWYGDLEQVDQIGACHAYDGDDYYDDYRGGRYRYRYRGYEY
jgi:hypothetical protein